ncbi:capA protein, putative [Pseudoalteromonas luteoviolacea B = ATCC 29581]|nr:capA protein, putative [Pseudoalteromonas luteoviolacea B = ATCC 29581]
MTKITLIHYVVFIKLFSLLIGCGGGKPDQTSTSPTTSQQDNISARETYLAKTSPLWLSFTGQSNNNVEVLLNGQKYLANANQVKTVPLKSGNYTLEITAEDTPTFYQIVHHDGTENVHTIQLPNALSVATTSLLFTGDSMMGRRFLDPNLSTMTNYVPSAINAQIKQESALADSNQLLQYVSPLIRSADFSSTNLETVLTRNPSSPHPSKRFVLFSLPETALALKESGFDYVALGNNHSFDYLEAGLVDTFAALDSANLTYSGAGINEEFAMQGTTFNLPSLELLLISATSIHGFEHDISYVATKNKAGAADLTNTALLRTKVLEATQKDAFTIVQLHSGAEYSYAPTSYITNRLELLGNLSPNLLVTHHPHVAQGFALYNKTPTLLGLGNFIFDQNRLETLLGLAVVTYVNQDTKEIEKALAYPIYLEDNIPKISTGTLAEKLIKRVATYSSEEITIIPRGGFAEVFFKPTQVKSSNRTVQIQLPEGETTLDMRQHFSENEFITAINLTNDKANVYFQLGMDLMYFGDFEDWDNDTETLEISRWNMNQESVSACFEGAYRGLQGVCLTRSQFDNTPLAFSFKHSLRAFPITPAEDTAQVYPQMSLIGYLKTPNSGKIYSEILYTYSASDGSSDLESESINSTYTSDTVLFEGGSTPWIQFEVPITLASRDDSNRVAFRVFPANGGETRVMLDELAQVVWLPNDKLNSTQWSQQRPNYYEFLKFSSDKATSITLTLTSIQ